MEGKKRGGLLTVLTVTLGLAAIIIYAYIHQLNAVITRSIVSNMEEISRHDMEAITAYIDNQWLELENVGAKFTLYNCQTLEDVQTRLNLERTASSFNKLYLYDDQGIVYSDSHDIRDAAEYEFDTFLEQEGERFVFRRGEDTDMVEQNRESLYYAVRLDEMEVEGIHFAGILGECELNSIQNRLKIDSFEGRGYSSVIDENGYFIVNVNRGASNGVPENFFDALANGKLETGETVEEFRERLRIEDDCQLSYTNSRGERFYLIFLPIDGTEWNFIMSVPYSVFREQTWTLMIMTFVLLALVAALLLALLLLMYRSSKAAMEAQAQAQVRTEFLSNMSHEIRTPLNEIMGLNHLLMLNIDDRDKMQEYLKKSQSTLQYFLALINDILDITKLQAGYVELREKPFSLENMLEDVWEMQRGNMDGKGIHLSLEKDIIEPCILGDELRIKQVLMHILGNAGKFTPQDGSVAVSIWQIREKDGRVRTFFEVKDTGCGMSEEFQKHIFEAFIQDRDANSAGQKGTGLGMSISYLLMKQMSGDLRVVSELGKGSCFTAEFLTSAAEMPDEGLKDMPDETGTEGAQTGHIQEQAEEEDRPLHILVVEDIELNAEVLGEMLGAVGYTVDYAENGKIAVDKFAASGIGEFDVILMDLQMPVMNGYEATMAIRELGRSDARTVKIFACTANTFKEDQERAAESGMDDFLAKPIDVGLLMEKLRERGKKVRQPA